MKVLLGATFLALVLSSAFNEPLAAQSLFKIYDTTNVNFVSYKYAEECFAATNRTSVLRASQRDSVWLDTVAFDITIWQRPHDAEVIDVARRCLSSIGANISTQLSSPSYGYIMVDLLLKIGEDSLARDLSDKLLSTIVGPDTLDIAFNLMRAYTAAIPVRLSDVEKIHNVMLKGITTKREFDLASIASGWLLGTYWSRGLDRSIFLRAFKKMEDFVDTLPADLIRRRSFFALASQMSIYAGVISKDEVRDSLIKSTASYRNFLTTKWNKFTGGHLQVPFSALAEVMPEPKGDLTYSKKANGEISVTAESAFRKGGVNATIFLHDGCHSETPQVPRGREWNGKRANCWKAIAGIRRLKERFPELSVTVVSRTWGNFASSPPVSLEKEAESIAKYFLGFHRLDANIVIAHPEFFRLPGYDRRKVDIPTNLDEDFVINNNQLNRTNMVVISDQENKIFHTGGIADDMEETVAFRIRAVLDRQL